MKLSAVVFDVFCVIIFILSVVFAVDFLSDPLALDKDFIDDLPPGDPAVSDPIRNKKKCMERTHVSAEQFTMKLNLCRKNTSVECEIGGASHCFRNREAFRAFAVVNKQIVECLIDANTTDFKYIRFIVKAKYLSNTNEQGSRGIIDKEIERQRGRCTLAYTCSNNRFLQDVKIDCFSFLYDALDRPTNGSEFHSKWVAPPNYDGPVIFGATIWISRKSFSVNVASAHMIIPDDYFD